MFSLSPMPSEKTMLLEQLEVMGALIPEIDATYAQLTRSLKFMSSILKKRVFNSEDQGMLKESLQGIHHILDHFSQLIRRGHGERELLRSEVVRVKSSKQNQGEDFSIVEAELWGLEQNLALREKAMSHLNELVQLLDSILKVGEMTEFDERLLTEIVTDLKNLGNA